MLACFLIRVSSHLTNQPDNFNINMVLKKDYIVNFITIIKLLFCIVTAMFQQIKKNKKTFIGHPFKYRSSSTSDQMRTRVNQYNLISKL